jgi:hypothetical protein
MRRLAQGRRRGHRKFVLERRREPSEGLAPLVVAGVGHAVSRLESEGTPSVLVAQNIELTLEPVADIVIPNSGSAVFTEAARDLEMNGAIVTNIRRCIGCHPGRRSDDPGPRDTAAMGPGYFATAKVRDDRNPG